MRGGLSSKLQGQPSQLLIIPAVIDQIARYPLRITIFAYPTCIRCCHYGGPVRILP